LAGRRCLAPIVLLAVALHTVAIARTLLPAQDGLKFIKVARQFQSAFWPDVIRATDRHPLYPILVTLTEPLVSSFMDPGPQAWRVAAQVVSALAALILLLPLYGLTRALFNDQIACLAVLIYVLLPLPADISQETLSDSLALLGFVMALRLGEVALRTGGWSASVGCGVAAGLGFLTRPEVLVAPLAVLLTAVTSRIRLWSPAFPKLALARLAALTAAFLAIVGGYALVKGEVSEKLAVRRVASLGYKSPVPVVRKATPKLPAGLDDPAWDFSAKEESEETLKGGVGDALVRVLLRWSEGSGWVFVPFVAWGVVRDRFIRAAIRRRDLERRPVEDDGERVAPRPQGSIGRRLILVYAALFVAVLVRHATSLGYLSGRHTLSLVVVAVPWAAAGVFICARGVALKLGWSGWRARTVGVAVLSVAIVAGVAFQLKPSHPTRWGHWAAGRWLATHTKTTDEVLDTRGWASFVAERPNYDYWHVRQALTDHRLQYVVVGEDELSAPSRRAATLRSILAYAAVPAASFPARRGGHQVGVRVFRFYHPDSWEELHP
jgi:hypothetical protein